jgi:hypothetical protein
LPARAKTFVPLLLSVPILLNASEPLIDYPGTRASVSTLFTRVGLFMNTLTAG